MSSIPSTKILDHIVHLTPPGTINQVSQQFRDLGFNVIPGGTHAEGLTANTLVILGDGTYLELIAFTHPVSHYPPGSPKRAHRDAHPWAHKAPGWIDFAFLGSGSDSSDIPRVSHIINARAAREQSGVHYDPETPGGRTRADDGRVLKWVITAVDDDHASLRGCVPFFCGDVTPRKWRVPVDPPSNALHPSGARGISYIRVLAPNNSLTRLAAQLTSVLGDFPQPNDTPTTGQEYIWTLEVPPPSSSSLSSDDGTAHAQKPRLVLSAPINDDERDHLATKGPGIFEVGFSVGLDGVEREASTPYGKIVWLRSGP